MANEPSLEDVQSFIEITGGQVTDQQARQLLKTADNKLERAISSFFDQGHTEAQSTGWDENHFTADKYGQYDSNIPSFQINNYDTTPADFSHTGAPTRPPSRTSHRSTDSGVNPVDIPISSVEVTGQESGVIGNSGPHFGPATRPFYDNSKWAVTLAGSSTHEFIPDVEINQRKREEGGPAFIKPLPSGDYLSALFTILHSIPLVRNAFLSLENLLPNYGHDGNWWTGTAITPSGPTEIGSRSTINPELELIHEVQRVVAFLDRTDRAYGSLEPLCNLDGFIKAAAELIDDYNKPDFHKFLIGWESAVHHQAPGYDASSLLHCTVNANGSLENSFWLDATVVHTTPGEPMTLYDVLDDHMFSDEGSAFVRDISNVLIVKLTQSDAGAKSLDVKIPAVFYADRYLESNERDITSMRHKIKQCEEEIERIETKRANFKVHKDKKTGESIDALLLLKTSIKAFEQPDGELEDPHDAYALTQLQAIYESIERKIKELDEQKQKARETLEQISGLFKGPIEEPTYENSNQSTSSSRKPIGENRVSYELPESVEKIPKVRYKLRGVSTQSNVIYVLSPVGPKDSSSGDTPTDAPQWWRVEYSYASAQPYITREKFTEKAVLEKASEERNEALLVYATDAAISAPLMPLPKPLEAFVKHDNLAFMEDLQTHEKGNTWEDQPPGYTSTYDPAKYDNWAQWNNVSKDGDEHNKRYEDMSGQEWLDSQTDNVSSNTLTPDTEMTEREGATGLVADMAGLNRTGAGGIDESQDVEMSDGANSMRVFQDSTTAIFSEGSDTEHIEYASQTR